MTSIYFPPVTPTNANSKATGKLTDSIESLVEQFQRANKFSFLQLNKELLRNSAVVSNLSIAFSSADKLQVKALAVNSNLQKVLLANKETLGKLRGDFFENAEELLLNFSEGIRENSDEVTALMNRMKLTGQSTELLRQVTKALVVTNRDGIVSAGRLARTTDKLSKDFLISSEKILQSVLKNSQLLDIPSLTGGSVEIAESIAALTSEITARGGSDAMVSQVANLLFSTDANSFQSRLVLGISDSFERVNKQGADIQKEIRVLLEKGAGYAKENLFVTKGAYKNEITDSILSQFGNKDQIIALTQVNDLLKRDLGITDAMRSKEDEFYKSASVVNAEALKFYQKTMSEVYPSLLNALPYIIQGSQIGGIGASVGYLGKLIGGAGIGRLLSFAGPIGVGLGILTTAIPLITNMMSSEDDSLKKTSKLQEEQLRVQKEISKKIAPPKTDESSKGDSLSKLISDSLYMIAVKDRDKKGSVVQENLATTLKELTNVLNKMKTKQTHFKAN
jgi:hypothetical protein